MDLFVVIVLLALSAFFWLLAAGERKRRYEHEERREADGSVRYSYSPLRAAAPAFAALACLLAGVQFFSARGAGGIVALFVGTAAALAFAGYAIAVYRERVDYLPGRGLRLARWSGYRWLPFERMAWVTYDSAHGKPDNYVARVTIRMQDGSSISLHDGLRGFEHLVERLAADCPEGVLETGAGDTPPRT